MADEALQVSLHHVKDAIIGRDLRVKVALQGQ